MYKNFTDFQLICSSSILTSRWVLTAAHCIRRKQLALGLYENLSLIKLSVGSLLWEDGQLYDVEKVVAHQHYHRKMYDFSNDIGMVKTKQPIQFSDSVKPIAIASSFVDGGESVIASGWGNRKEQHFLFSNIMYSLRFVQMKTMTNGKCEKFDFGHEDVINCRMLCAASPNPQTPCNRDAGGPLVKDGQLVGIASLVTHEMNNCNPNMPTVFTRVSKFVKWINEQIEPNEYLD